MNRAMFSGVAGMKAHQTKMDVIGNNIANVNTFGYKGQRAVFSDIYYQNLRNASAGTANRGGTNPSSVGYGSSLAAIQANMTQSSMQNTGFGLDVAIAGDGFLQVMDPDGNIFYTKAGLLDYDSNGYLTDINGNFVLGSTDPKGEPGSNKIKLDNMGAVDAKQASTELTINGVKYTVSASNSSAAGNVNLTLASSDALPAGQRAVAIISSNGTVNVTLNATEKFNDMADLNNAINNAILQANSGKPLDAGTITIATDKNVFGKDAASGSFTGSAFAEAGKIAKKDGSSGLSLFSNTLEISSFGIDNWGAGQDPMSFSVSATPANKLTISTTIDGVAYSAVIDANANQGLAFNLETTPAGTNKISMKLPEGGGGAQGLLNAAGTADTTLKATPPVSFLGGAKITSMGSNFSGEGPITFAITNTTHPLAFTATIGGKIYKGLIPEPGGTVKLELDPAVANDNITMTVPSFTDMKKALGIAPGAAIGDADVLTKITSSLTNADYKAVAATNALNTPLTGAQIVEENKGVDTGILDFGTAKLFGGAMTFQKAGTGFSGSGDTKVDAQFTEATADAKAFWTVTIKAGGKTYEAKIDEDTTASSILLKGPTDDDFLQMTNPKMDGLKSYYKSLNGDQDPVNGNSMSGISGGTITASPSIPSKNLGLGTGNFTLTGGTEGGTITLDQLTNISIGADGMVSVNHADKGTVNVGRICLANFANNSGLQLEGNNYYTATSNSGKPVVADPGTKGTGSLKNSALEMSNVDLSAEFADMITTQRGFQANSRIITVSDTMLEELINLKR